MGTWEMSIIKGKGLTQPVVCESETRLYLGAQGVHDRAGNQVGRALLSRLQHGAVAQLAIDTDVAVVQHRHLVQNVQVLGVVVDLR